MGWEQLAPAVQGAFDTYWGRKDKQKGREHEMEMQRLRLLKQEELFLKELGHNALLEENRLQQNQLQEDERNRLTEEGWDREDARRELDRESDEMMELARQSFADWSTRQAEGREEIREGEQWKRESTFEAGESALDRASREKVAGMMQAEGKEFSPGGLALEIQSRADEANALFKMGWDDFSAIFPRMMSKETYDSLKATAKDKEIADYLLAEITKNYIHMYENEALAGGVNLPKELNYLLNIPDDFMQTIQADFDTAVAQAKQKKITRKERRIERTEELGGGYEEYRKYMRGPAPSDERLGIGFKGLSEKIQKTFGVFDEALAGEDSWWEKLKKKNKKKK